MQLTRALKRAIETESSFSVELRRVSLEIIALHEMFKEADARLRVADLMLELVGIGMRDGGDASKLRSAYMIVRNARACLRKPRSCRRPDDLRLAFAAITATHEADGQTYSRLRRVIDGIITAVDTEAWRYGVDQLVEARRSLSALRARLRELKSSLHAISDARAEAKALARWVVAE